MAEDLVVESTRRAPSRAGEDAILRASLGEQLGKYSDMEPLVARINDLCFFFYQPLFKNLTLLREEIVFRNVTRLDVHGYPARGYSGVTSKGDEGRSVLYYPSFLYPRYIERILPPSVGIRYAVNRLSGLISALMLRARPWAIFFIKLVFAVRANFRRRSSNRISGENFDFILVGRSFAPLEYYAGLVRALIEARPGVRVAVFYDPSLHDFHKPEPKHYFPDSQVRFVSAHDYGSFVSRTQRGEN